MVGVRSGRVGGHAETHTFTKRVKLNLFAVFCKCVSRAVEGGGRVGACGVRLRSARASVELAEMLNGGQLEL